MQVSRFWSSVGSVLLYLLAVGLFQYIVQAIASLFGLMPNGLMDWITALVAVIVPIVGTIAYLDWRWGWRLEHIGMGLNSRTLSRLLLGLALGLCAAFLTRSISWLAGARAEALLPTSWDLHGFTVPDLVTYLGGAFTVEMVFRGVVASRYEADLNGWEAIGAALFTPFVWILLQSIFRFGALLTGANTFWLAAMSASLTLLFLRTDSTWLTAGIRLGMMVGIMFLPLPASDTSASFLWGAVAVALLALEWFRQQSMPRRVPPRRGPQRVVRGKTIRGPWGPH